MPPEHCVMTVQSTWNIEPAASATVSTVIETDGMTAIGVFEAVKERAVAEWHSTHPTKVLGKTSVMHYSRHINEAPRQD